jgi:hypothetical protein
MTTESSTNEALSPNPQDEQREFDEETFQSGESLRHLAEADRWETFMVLQQEEAQRMMVESSRAAEQPSSRAAEQPSSRAAKDLCRQAEDLRAASEELGQLNRELRETFSSLLGGQAN